MPTPHRKDSRSRCRSAPNPSTGPTKNTRMNRRIEETEKRRLRPFAHSPIRRFPLFLACVFAIGFAGVTFAQDEEEEDVASNAKPDAGGVVIEPSSGKIAEGDAIT